MSIFYLTEVKNLQKTVNFTAYLDTDTNLTEPQIRGCTIGGKCTHQKDGHCNAFLAGSTTKTEEWKNPSCVLTDEGIIPDLWSSTGSSLFRSNHEKVMDEITTT